MKSIVCDDSESLCHTKTMVLLEKHLRLKLSLFHEANGPVTEHHILVMRVFALCVRGRLKAMVPNYSLKVGTVRAPECFIRTQVQASVYV